MYANKKIVFISTIFSLVFSLNALGGEETDKRNIESDLVGVYSLQNTKKPPAPNEDTYSNTTFGNQLILAVFDGHGGEQCSTYLKQNFHTAYLDAEGKIVSEKLKNAVIQIDKDWLEQAENNGNESGSTAIIAIVDQKKNQVHFANTGDSRGILIRNGTVKAWTNDHTPENNKNECERIIAAGGFFWNDRVNGKLAVTRAIGDKDLKQFGVIPDPDITSLDLENGDAIVLVSDGVHNTMENDEIADFVSKKFHENKSISEIAEALVFKAREKESKDDITAVVYRHSKNKSSRNPSHHANTKNSDESQTKDVSVKKNKKTKFPGKKLIFLGSTTAIVIFLYFWYHSFSLSNKH